MNSKYTLDILVVCTGNICRSSTAEILLSRGLQAESVRIRSAGTRASVGQSIPGRLAAMLTEEGFDPSGAAASQLTAETIEHSDLVLTMTREQRSAVVRLVPSAVHRTFTLLEFTRLARWRLDGGDGTANGLATAKLAEVMAAARASRGLLPAVGKADDIPDPRRNSRRAYRLMIQQIETPVEMLLAWVNPGHSQEDRVWSRPTVRGKLERVNA